MALSLVSYGDSDSENEAEDKTSSDVQPESDVRRLLSVLPARGPMKQKGPVKIGLPTLSKDDSDSDDDVPVPKRKKMGGGGLTALLPEPKGGGKELGFGRKASSSTKTMVPYTLSKRYQDSKKKKAPPKKPKTATKSGEDSDSDGDTPASFFSLEETNPIPKPSGLVPTPDNPIPEAETSSAEVAPQTDSNTVGPSFPQQYSSSDYYVTPQYAGANEQYAVVQDPSMQGYPNQYPGVSGANEQYAVVQDPSIQGYPNQYPEVSQQYPEVTQQYSQVTPDDSVPGASAVGPGLSIDDEQLRRLAGVQRGKKKEEGLQNITEIREADVKEGIKAFQKYNTEESVNKFFQTEASKMDAPTSQQKRKHQLSFLAHQAKAKELELSKHWAQAAATRRQTKMKYGF